MSELKLIGYNDLLKLNEDERLCFYLNMYHCLFAHCLLLFGAPSTSNRSRFYCVNSFECGNCVFSLMELEHGILRGGMTLIKKSSKYSATPRRFNSNSGPDFDPRSKLILTRMDHRLMMAVHWGTILYGNLVPIYNSNQSQYNEQLQKICKHCASLVKINVSNKAITFPKVFEQFLCDFPAKQEMFLSSIFPYLSDRKKEEINNMMQGGADGVRKIYFQKTDPSPPHRLEALL